MKIRIKIRAGQCSSRAKGAGHSDHPGASAPGEGINPGPLSWLHLPRLK